MTDKVTSDKLPKTQREHHVVIRRKLRAIDRLANEMLACSQEIGRRLAAMEAGPLRNRLDDEPTDPELLKLIMTMLFEGSRPEAEPKETDLVKALAALEQEADGAA